MLLFVLVAPSCARGPAGPQRLAILRFENLSHDPSLDWMGRAFSEVLFSLLAAAPPLYPVDPARIRAADRALGGRPLAAPGISAEQAGALAAGANRLGYGTYWISNGKLQARLAIQNPDRLQDFCLLAASAPSGDLPAAAQALARQISNRAGSYRVSSVDALKDYSLALESPDSSGMQAQAALAIAADPDFGPAYRLLIQAKAPEDPNGALALAEKALLRPGLRPAERARLQVEAAGLRDDAAARQRGLADLAKAEPTGIDAWRSLASTAFGRRDFQTALDAWRKVLAAQPEDAAALNQLGYAAAYAGDMSAATSALHRYAALRPQDANPLDSLGDVYLIAGRLHEAEQFYLQAARKDPNFYAGGDWFKAALARLMTGDVARADALAGQFADARSARRDPSVSMFKAQWQWISGRRQAAYRALEEFARATQTGPLRFMASRAYSQLSIWSLVSGDLPAAREMSSRAVALAGPPSQVDAAMASFLTQPAASAAEWQARAGRLAPTPAQHAIRDTALAYALLLSGQFAPAAGVLERLSNFEGPKPEGLPVLLAWSYLETGQAKKAAPLLQFNPVPAVTGPEFFTALYFPRIFDLRARLAEQQGRTDEARAERRLFAILSGGE